MRVHPSCELLVKNVRLILLFIGRVLRFNEGLGYDYLKVDTEHYKDGVKYVYVLAEEHTS